jgi:multimeric flavodoxin WrbA
MQAVCLLGSPRPDGSTAAILAEIARALESCGARVTTYCLGCKACHANGACVTADDTQAIIEAIKAARLVVVASPSYWGGVTAQLKTFIDRLTPYGNTNPARRPFPQGIVGAAVAVRAGSRKEENMRLVADIAHFLSHLDIPLIAHFTAEGVGTPEDLKRRPSVLADAYAFGETLYAAALTHGQP